MIGTISSSTVIELGMLQILSYRMILLIKFRGWSFDVMGIRMRHYNTDGISFINESVYPFTTE